MLLDGAGSKLQAQDCLEAAWDQHSPGRGGTEAFTAGHCHIGSAPSVRDLLLKLLHVADPWERREVWSDASSRAWLEG